MLWGIQNQFLVNKSLSMMWFTYNDTCFYFSLETYTLRSGYSTVMEAETLDNRTRACPQGDMPICLVGLRPFMGVKQLAASNNHLILLSTSAEDNNIEAVKPKWTLYNLSLPASLALYKDMIQLANMNKALSPHGYLQLICEAHIVIRTSCHQLSWLMTVTKESNLEEQLKVTRESYQDSCQLLGNYYALLSEASEAKLALPYYRMSTKPILRILEKAKEVWRAEQPKAKQLPSGLVHYITEIIINPVEGEDILKANLADLIIDLLGEHALDALASLVLKSKSFRQFKSTKIHKYLSNFFEINQPRNSEAVHVLAFVVLAVDKGGDLEEARQHLQTLSPVRLSEIILEYHDFLVEAAGTEHSLSEVAIILRDSVPMTFVEILASLIKSDVYTLPMVLHLLIGSLVSTSSMMVSASNDSAILQLFLEAYFTDIIESTVDEIILDGDQLQALHTLVRSYLTSLSVPVRFGEKNIDCNMFGNRHLYLDQLPPFNSNTKETMMSADSPDFWCQNSLLKLQSLLCSNLCRGASCKSIVQGYLDLKPDNIGALSLKILCLDDAKSSVPILVDHHPDVLLPFAKENSVDLDSWKLMLNCLQDQLSSKPQDPDHEAWYSAMQEILDHLAQTLVLESFLDILPGSQNNEDFQGYIQLCRKNQQAHQIQNLIVTTGHKLLSTLTF
jgi:hypothetical protein